MGASLWTIAFDRSGPRRAGFRAIASMRSRSRCASRRRRARRAPPRCPPRRRIRERRPEPVQRSTRAEGVRRRTGRAHRPRHAAIGDDAPSGGRRASEHGGAGGVRPRGAPDMHFVAGNGRAVGEHATADARAAFFPGSARSRRRAARGPPRSRRPLDPVRIGDAVPEHLVAAAEPEHAPAAAHVGARGRCPSPRRATRRGRRWWTSSRAGSRDRRRRAAARRGCTSTSSTCRAPPQRVEVVEIGDARQHAARRPDAARRLAHARRRERRARPRPAAGGVGEDTAPAPRHGQPVRRRSRACRRRTGAGSPRNLLTMKPRDHARRRPVEHRVGADEAARSRRRGRCRRPAPPARPAARAKPMLAMSPARRLISAGLPAPSTSTRSASARRRAKLSSTARQQLRLHAPGSSRALGVADASGPAR